MNVKERKEAIFGIIEDARKLLTALRMECPHENGQYIYKGSTGNWSESDDSYWRVNTCLDCGHDWYEYSEIDGVRNRMYTQNPEGNWTEVRDRW